MINRRYDILILLALLFVGTGCQMSWLRKEPRYVDPALPMTLGCHELVNYLNHQNQGLEGWRCTSTVMWVRLPNGIRQRLEGVIACQAPQYFRLTAENMIADADLGSNASRCWMYSRPGDPAVLTWRHEDTALLQQVPTGMPHIDPAWLMVILGITPLDVNDYELSRAPAGTQELWLTAIEDGPSGRPIRRVIKVDSVRGVIREHAVFDSEGRAIARAELSEHKSYGGHLIPGKVKLVFPEMDSEISLAFKRIETNPHLPDELWQIPDRNMQVVDLGDVIRSRMVPQGRGSAAEQGSPFSLPRANLQPPVFDPPPKTAFGEKDTAFDGVSPNANGEQASEFGNNKIAEPEWATPISTSRTADDDASFQRPAPPRQEPRAPKERRLFPWLN